MVDHKIQHHPDAAFVQFCEQRIEVVHAAEDWVDGTVIGHIVAEIEHRRCINRREPDGIDAELSEIVDFFADAGEVADAVAIRIFETARVDLVDHRFFIPGRCDSAELLL